MGARGGTAKGGGGAALARVTIGETRRGWVHRLEGLTAVEHAPQQRRGWRLQRSFEHAPRAVRLCYPGWVLEAQGRGCFCALRSAHAALDRLGHRPTPHCCARPTLSPLQLCAASKAQPKLSELHGRAIFVDAHAAERLPHGPGDRQCVACLGGCPEPGTALPAGGLGPALAQHASGTGESGSPCSAWSPPSHTHSHLP